METFQRWTLCIETFIYGFNIFATISYYLKEGLKSH